MLQVTQSSPFLLVLTSMFDITDAEVDGEAEGFDHADYFGGTVHDVWAECIISATVELTTLSISCPYRINGIILENVTRILITLNLTPFPSEAFLATVSGSSSSRESGSHLHKSLTIFLPLS